MVNAAQGLNAAKHTTNPMRSLLLTLAFGPLLAKAQTVFFHFTDGTTQSYAVADIRKLTFVGDEQVLWLNDGTQYTWNVSTIGQYEFDETIGIEHIASGPAPLKLSVYPNPATAAVTLDTELPQAARLVVDILDLQGRVVRGLFAGERPAGTHRHSIPHQHKVSPAPVHRAHKILHLPRLPGLFQIPGFLPILFFRSIPGGFILPSHHGPDENNRQDQQVRPVGNPHRLLHPGLITTPPAEVVIPSFPT